MIDTHCHILPSVDDGSKSMEETLEMARIAVSEGIHYIIATPHYIEYSDYLNKKQLTEVVKQVNKELELANIKLTIGLGHEVYLTPDLPKLVETEEVSTLNDSNYLLLEFPMNDIPIYAEDVIYELKLMGITPIIAHPERYPMIIEDPNLLLKYLSIGALCQINMGSIIGAFGTKVQETAMILIEHNMAQLVATDAHSTRRRSPKMQQALAHVVTLEGSQKANTLFVENPFKIYSNLPIEPAEPIEYKKPNLISKILGKIKKN
ncbi:MAG: tyrosine-protein phosphatase [Turicibacter sp.]